MPPLKTSFNELSKDPQTQFAQIQYALNDIMNLSNQTTSKILVDYDEPTQPNNETTSSTTFTPIQNFTFTFSPNNPMCNVLIHLYLQGKGYIGIFFNDLLTKEIFFDNATPSLLSYNKIFQLSNNRTTISIRWRSAIAGTAITKVNTNNQPGTNSVQLKSENS